MTREQDQAAFEAWNEKAYRAWVNAGCPEDQTKLEQIWHAALAYARSQKPEDVNHENLIHDKMKDQGWK